MLYDLVMKYLYPSSSSSQVPLLTASSTPNKDNDEDDDFFIKTNPIFLKDLQQVKLKPWSIEQQQQQKYKQQKYGKINVQSLSNNQLNDIMNVKLRKTITKAPQTVFEIRHPCLRELLERRLVQP
jgi:hypothetical protein